MEHACTVFAKRVAADEHRDIDVANDAIMAAFFVVIGRNFAGQCSGVVFVLAERTKKKLARLMSIHPSYSYSSNYTKYGITASWGISKRRVLGARFQGLGATTTAPSALLP